MLLPKLLGALGALSLAHVAVALESPPYVRRNASTDSTAKGDTSDSGDSGFTIQTNPNPHCPDEYKMCLDHRAQDCFTAPPCYPETVTVTVPGHGSTVTIPASTVTVPVTVTASGYKVTVTDTVTVSASPVTVTHVTTEVQKSTETVS